MSNASGNDKLSFWSTVSIGVGGMVGGGIFAVLGLAVQLAHGGTMVSFAIAGVIALITAYSYSKLSVTFPCQGGTVEYLNQGFGTGLFSGGLNILLWISYIIMLSLYAYAFGSYGASFFPDSVQPFWKHTFISLGVVLFTLLNIFGSSLVGKSEEYIVAIQSINPTCFFRPWTYYPGCDSAGAVHLDRSRTVGGRRYDYLFGLRRF